MSIEDVELPVGPWTFRARAAGPADGELVLLLHGFPQTSWEWRHQLEALGDAGYRAVAPDQRGYSPGARPEGVEHYEISLLVGDVLAIADELGGHRFHLVGHDWGCIVAWHVAAAHPHRLKTLTAVSVPHPAAWRTAFEDPSSDQRERSTYIAGFKDPGAEEALGEEFLRTAFDNSGLAGHDVEPHVAVLRDTAAMGAALNWYRSYDFDQLELPDVEVPTMFVWSTEDPAIAREGAERTAAHVTAPYRFEVFEGEGHWIPEAAGERLTGLLLHHLAEHG